ncbi:MAG: T9SS type A sorting domain-containing protein [Fidelibacterota bacterium]
MRSPGNVFFRRDNRMNKMIQDKHVAVLAMFLLFAGLAVVSGQDYVGSERCLVCHNGGIAVDRTGWRGSMHANGFSVPTGDSSMVDLYGVVADADQNGTDDFKDGLDLSTTEAFSAYGANAPVLGYNETDDEYTITIGDLTMPVKLTYGGSGLYKQRYVVKVPVTGGVFTAGHYVSPVQYDEKTHEYVAYHPENWYDSDNLPLFGTSSTAADVADAGRSFEKKCVGCHFTFTESISQNSDNEWVADAPDAGSSDTGPGVYDVDGDGTLDLINTGCERCHGPGGDHPGSDASATIINPDSLTTQQANDLCGFCHSRGHSVPNGTFSYPYFDTPGSMEDWEVGDAWGDYYADGGGYYPDGTHEGEIRNSKKHHQQYFDFYESSKPTFMWHEVRCYECHDVHNEVKHHIREEIVEEDSEGNELVIATENDNNTLCLACHATHGHFEALTKEMVADPVTYADTIAAVVSEHTNHEYDPDGTGESRCSKCHNPKTIKSAIYYDIHSHTFEPISPQKTLEYAMPNACAASCHRGIENGASPIFGTGADQSISAWDEAEDIALADTLLYYFGPGGIWWDVDQVLTIVPWVDGGIPEGYSLRQNYPNPFNPITTIPLELSTEGRVQVVLFNILGQELATVMNRYLAPGEYRILVNAEALPSGVYFYRMTVRVLEGDVAFEDQKKMVVLK